MGFRQIVGKWGGVGEGFELNNLQIDFLQYTGIYFFCKDEVERKGPFHFDSLLRAYTKAVKLFYMFMMVKHLGASV